jgi:hypothetical protein
MKMRFEQQPVDFTLQNEVIVLSAYRSYDGGISAILHIVGLAVSPRYVIQPNI